MQYTVLVHRTCTSIVVVQCHTVGRDGGWGRARATCSVYVRILHTVNVRPYTEVNVYPSQLSWGQSDSELMK